MKNNLQTAYLLVLLCAGILTGCTSGTKEKRLQAERTTVAKDTVQEYIKEDTSITFSVDDVTGAKYGYNIFPLRKVIQQQFVSPVFIAPEKDNGKMAPTNGNSFLYTVHYAYANHHPLVLSPDDVWMQIALGVSLHINENYEKLQPKVMRFKDRQEIKVTMDELSALKPASWQRLVDTFALLTEAKVQPEFYKVMLPEFSTSTPLTKTAFRAAMMSSVKKGISYIGESGCGIPSVTLLGKKSDWEDIYQRLDALKKYDLGFWTEELKPVLQEFINVYDHKTDKQFWQRIYKYREGYMMQDVNGWIIKFFPYLTKYAQTGNMVTVGTDEEDSYEMPATQEVYYKNPYLKGNEYIHSVLDLGVFPQSFCSVPITWNNFFAKKESDQVKKLKLVAGFFGFDQSGKDFALKPHLSWVILDESAAPADGPAAVEWKDRLSATKKHLPFDKYAWSDKILQGKQVNARYNPGKNKNFNTGINEFKSELVQHMQTVFPKESLEGTQLSFVLTWIGHIVDISVKNTKLSPKAVAELRSRLLKMKYEFRPSQVENDLPIDSDRKSLPASSKITVRF